MSIVKAPFTDEQVRRLKFWQSGEILYDEGGKTIARPVHPFTCCSHDGCKRSEQPNEGALIPSNEGWVCPCGKYKQDWAHDFMMP